MNRDYARSDRRPSRTAVAIAGRPVFPPLASVPLVCFAGALLTDIVYSQSPQMQWTNFSAWLITAGLVFALFATIVGAIDFFRSARSGLAILHVGLVLAAYVVELFNIFVHSRDAYTSVVPTGLTLSAIAVAMLLVGNWLGAGLRYRRVSGAAA